MPSKTGKVPVATTSHTYKGKLCRFHLLRRTFRVGTQVQHETRGSISDLPPDLIRRSLGGQKFLPASKSSRQRDLVMAMIAERLQYSCSKLATTRLWHTTTLIEELHVAEATESDLYQTLDWLLARRAHIGHNRDGKRGLPIIVYGLLTDHEGRPVASGARFQQLTEATPLQARALQLLGLWPEAKPRRAPFPNQISRIVPIAAWNFGLVGVPRTLAGRRAEARRQAERPDSTFMSHTLNAGRLPQESRTG
jgi:hypothetical protein